MLKEKRNIFIALLMLLTIIINGCIQPPPKSKSKGKFGDNPTVPLLAISSGTSTITESNTTLNIPISLNMASTSNVIVYWRIINTGQPPTVSAFTSTFGSLAIPAGNKYSQISLLLIDDSFVETNETVYLQLFNVSGASLGSPSSKLITIIDNDSSNLPTIYFPTTSSVATEGFDLSVNIQVALSAPLNYDLNVPFIVYGEATYPDDHGLVSGIVTIPIGNLSQTINVSITNDAIMEGSENMHIELLGNSDVLLNSARTYTLLIADDEIGADINFQGPVTVTATEDVGNILATINLSSVHAVDTIINFTASGNATAGTDYNAVSSITIPAGAITYTVTFSLIDDLIDEYDQIIEYTITSADHGTIGASNSFTINLLDNDAIPDLTFDSSSQTVTELNSGFHTQYIPITLSLASEKIITIDYDLSGTAAAGFDYSNLTGYTSGATGTLTIAPGTLSTDMIFISHGDLIDEADETIILSLATASQINVNASGLLTHTATIIDDDDPPIVYFATISSITDEDFPTHNVTISLATTSQQDIIINFNPGIAGTAANPADYSFGAGTLTIPAGNTAATFPLTLVNGDGSEPLETIILNLDTITNGATSALYNIQHTVLLVDTDTLPNVSFTTTTSTISESSTIITITATLDKLSARDIEFEFNYSGTATTTLPYNDITLISTPVIIVAGSYSTNFDITLIDDIVIEATESITVIATNITSYATITNVASVSYTLNIIDNDYTVPEIRFSDPNTHFITETATIYPLLIQIDGARTFSTDTEVYITLTTSLTTATASPNISPDFDWSGSASWAATVTIPAYSSTANLNITLFDDLSDEPDTESISFKIDSISADATIGSVDTALIIINDNDDIPIVNFEDITLNITEGIVFAATVTLSATSTYDVTVPITIDSTLSTAAATDHNFVNSSLTIWAGTTTATTALILITDDLIDEATESLVLNLGTIVNALSGATTTLTINLIDNDAFPLINFATPSYTVTETNTDTTYGTTITLSQMSSFDISIDLTASISTTASLGIDYNFTYGTYSIPAGETTIFATTTIIGDLMDEPNKQVIIVMATPSNVIIGSTSIHTIDLVDDDVAPSIRFYMANGSVSEGATYSFFVTLTATSQQDILIDLSYNALSTSSATSGVDHDFITTSVTVPAGMLTVSSASFDFLNDAIYDDAETLVIDLVNPVNTSTAAPSTFTLNITDGSAPPTVGMLDDQIVLFESNSEGPTNYMVTVQQSFISGTDTTINFNTTNFNGATGADYTILPASPFIISAGNTTATAVITITADVLTDPNEYFDIDFTTVTGASSASYSNLRVFINDEYTADASGSLTPTSLTVTENSTFAINFIISEPLAIDITMTYQLDTPSSSASISDISPSSGIVTITQGTTSSSIIFTALDDSLNEVNELANIAIASISTGIIDTAGATSSITIIDDDPMTKVNFQSNSSSFNEGAAQGDFTFVLDNAVGSDVGIPYTVSATSTANDPGDYTLIASTATISAGNTTVTVTFSIVDDNTDEYNETVVILMEPPTGATVGSITYHTISITDDDSAPYINFIAPASPVNENVGQIDLIISLTNISEKVMTLPYVYGPSNETVYSTDHDLVVAGSITVPTGVTTAAITFNILDDTQFENSEIFQLSMSTPTNLELGTTTTASFSITDNDTAPTVDVGAVSSNISEETGNANIQFALSAVSGKDTTVTYSLQPTSTASNLGVDHGLVDGSTIITAGQLYGYSATFSIVDDVLTEDSETIIVSISGATNATINWASATHTMTIEDNDDIQVAIGAKHTCTLVDGGVYCWGDNTFGQRGMEVVTAAFGDDVGEHVTQLTSTGTVQLGNDLGGFPFVVKQLVAGNEHTCALSTTGSVKCWGANDEGQLGIGSIDPGGIGNDSNEMGTNLPNVLIGSGITATKLSAGAKHTCTLLSDDSIKCWGSTGSNDGILGQPLVASLGIATNDIYNSASILFQNSARDIASGGYHNCARFAGPNLECWGVNSDGQLGHDGTSSKGYNTDDFDPADFIDLDNISFNNIIMGQKHSCILSESTSEVKCWGLNSSGQLGLGDSMNRGDDITFTASPGVPQTTNTMNDLPTLPLPLAVTVQKITTGLNHTCMHLSNNQVRCWGKNNLGQLGADNIANHGDDVTETSSNAAVIDINDGFIIYDLFSGGDHNCGKVGTRSIKCWGSNDKGQLLNEDTTNYGTGIIGAGTDHVTDSATLSF